MSTVETRIKAAKSLIMMRTCGDRRFPRIFILGTKTCPFINPLRRIAGDDRNAVIEEMSIHEAYMILYGRKMDAEELKQVDWNMDSHGATFNGQLYCPEVEVPQRRSSELSGVPEVVEMTPMDKNWQEKRERAAKEAETEEAPEEVQEVAEVPADAEPKVQDDIERQMIVDALAECKWIKTKTADYLGITVDTLNKRIKKYNIIIDKKK